MQRKTGCVVWVVMVAAVAALFLAWQYREYRLTNRTLPPGTTMAGLAVERMTPEQALNALEVSFATPLTVTYQDQTLFLFPSAVELRYDAHQTRVHLDSALEDWRGLEGFASYVLRQQPAPRSIPVAVTYSEERLARFLDRVSNQYDGPPQAPAALPAALDVRSGRPGTTLDVEASRARVASALLSASVQDVELVVEIEKPPPKDLSLLEQLLESRLREHAGLTPGIFVKDLATGDELSINGGVAFSGLSVMKIAILEEVYRTLDHPPDGELTKLIADTMTESDNVAANLLLGHLDDERSPYRAVEELTASMRRLGLVNTYMSAPYDEKEVGTEIRTAANARSDVTTDADPFIQTTPLDVGLLLEMIYQCSHGGGSLLMTYPDSVTAEECRQMIGWMGENRIGSLIEAGVPADTMVAHKQGLTTDTHADAGLLFTPGGDSVLVIFLHRPDWLEWDESEPLIADIATATYHYLNPSR